MNPSKHFKKLTQGLWLLGCLSAYGQSVEFKDRHGIPLVILNDVKMFRYSEYFKAEIPEFQATVKNLTELDIDVPLDATIKFKNGSERTFDSFVSVGLRKRAVKTFMSPYPYTSENFESVRFSVNKRWQSPEDRRLAEMENERRLRRHIEEANRQQSLKRAALRANCTQVYERTSDKKLLELTVKEAQSVQACQSMGLYPPK